jgi:hypothetical protein
VQLLHEGKYEHAGAHDDLLARHVHGDLTGLGVVDGVALASGDDEGLVRSGDPDAPDHEEDD